MTKPGINVTLKTKQTLGKPKCDNKCPGKSKLLMLWQLLLQIIIYRTTWKCITLRYEAQSRTTDGRSERRALAAHVQSV